MTRSRQLWSAVDQRARRRWTLTIVLVSACGGQASIESNDAGRASLEASVIREAEAASEAVDAALSGEGSPESNAEPGLVGPAKALGVGWSAVVTDRCVSCAGPELEGCLAEDGVLVPSPFELICLTQLAESNAEVRAYLDERARIEQHTIEQWASVTCGEVFPPPDEPARPDAARPCFRRDFTCPESRLATACDRISECLSGEDERFCGVIASTFVCHHGAQLAWSRVCDGVRDCEFAEDENNCFARPMR